MAASVTYTTINSQIVHEVRAAVGRSYIPDPLMNTAALAGPDGAQTDAWEYWPYGEVQGHTGGSLTALAFHGIVGYFADSLGASYVRARHLRTDLTLWRTVDPFWPNQGAFVYVRRQAVLKKDASGMGGPGGAGAGAGAGVVVGCSRPRGGPKPPADVFCDGHCCDACLALCATPAFEVCWECYNTCDTVHSLYDLHTEIDRVMSMRGGCTHPNSLADCLQCPNKGRYLTSNCKDCMNGLAVNDDYSDCWCKWIGERNPFPPTKPIPPPKGNPCAGL